jgi:hypothetical protein
MIIVMVIIRLNGIFINYQIQIKKIENRKKYPNNQLYKNGATGRRGLID